MNSNLKWQTRMLGACVGGLAATALALSGSTAMAQGQGSGKGGGHDSGSTSHDDGHSSHDGGSGSGRGGQGGRESGRGKGGGHGSLRDVFREMEDEAAAEKGKKASPQSTAPSAEKGKGSSQAKKGQKTDRAVAEEEDSDRPAWAGKNPTEPKPGSRSTESGTKKGDIYGDLYIVKRDENGDPILVGGQLQVYYVVTAADGTKTLACCIPYVDGELNTADYTPAEVELGRLSVGRSPDRVLAAQLEEASKAILSATSISLDASGRIVITTADGTSTIDSPLENLALYKELLTTGTIAIEKADGSLVDLSAIGIDANSALTDKELLLAASLFAAASDKTIPITIDSVIYMNTILGIPDDVSYSTLTSYSRDTLYNITDVNLQPVVLQDPENDGTWTATSINPYVTIFGSEPASESPTVEDNNAILSSAEAFAAAADDARTVIDFLHTYPVPSN
ncbi:MAG: hypothetical protein AB7I44_18335 [Hyphomicrobiaceae bacterium]